MCVGMDGDEYSNEKYNSKNYKLVIIRKLKNLLQILKNYFKFKIFKFRNKKVRKVCCNRCSTTYYIMNYKTIKHDVIYKDELRCNITVTQCFSCNKCGNILFIE